ncbi:polycystic kidney disease protein 1-like 3 [Oryzias latipes]|uniref:polycystic kidney disease protein 1-like 3 n=1 Tax=Oryzias latipes TaxID=8090 RepID=UPI000CE248E4|nr:polycystic kidney disease protein 1-like 3 [Oryzias latipes]
MEETEQRYTWRSLLLPNPSDPDNPRLVVRRIPIPGTSENPEETINSVPKTPTGPVPEFGLSSSSDSDSPPRSLSAASSASPPTQCSSSHKEDFTGNHVGRCDGPSSSHRSPKTSSNVQLSSSTSLTEQRYTWKSLLLPNPSDPDDPILVLRRIPIPGTSENPEETINSVPKTQTGAVPEFGLSSSSDSDSPPQKYLYAPSSPNINSVPRTPTGGLSFSSDSDTPPRRFSTASSASPPTQCSSSHKEDFWTYEKLKDQDKLVLKRQHTGNPVGRCDGPSSSKRPSNTSHPKIKPVPPPKMNITNAKWVKKLKAILAERKREHGQQNFKRSAKSTDAAPTAKKMKKTNS